MQVTTYNRPVEIRLRTLTSVAEAIEIAKSIATQLEDYSEKMPYVRYGGSSYKLSKHSGIDCPYGLTEGDLPVASKLIGIGDARIRTVESEIRKEIEPYPEIVAEVKLSSETGSKLPQVLHEVAYRKRNELADLFEGVRLVDSLSTTLDWQILGEQYTIIIKDSGVVKLRADTFGIRKSIDFLRRFKRIREKTLEVRRTLV